MHNQVEKICRCKACLGCGLCVDEKSKQKMELYADGYYHPSEKALIDPDFKKFCPGFGIYQNIRKKQNKKYYTVQLFHLWFVVMPPIRR